MHPATRHCIGGTLRLLTLTRLAGVQPSAISEAVRFTKQPVSAVTILEWPYQEQRASWPLEPASVGRPVDPRLLPRFFWPRRKTGEEHRPRRPGGGLGLMVMVPSGGGESKVNARQDIAQSLGVASRQNRKPFVPYKQDHDPIFCLFNLNAFANVVSEPQMQPSDLFRAPIRSPRKSSIG